MNRKTVFVLGAGFSCPARIPLQNRLLAEIFSYEPDFEEPAVLIAQDALKRFIMDLFSQQKNIVLEDIFTILDRCVIGKERFKSYTWQELYKLREQLVYLILFIINERILSIPQEVRDIYLNFAKHLIHLRRSNGQKKDTIAVICLNWDTVLELFIRQAMTKQQKLNTAIDYCAYTHFLSKKGVSNIHLKVLGNYNIKVLKLHGSLNWLYCSNCGRLYVDDEYNIGIQSEECRFCFIKSSQNKLLLEPLIITPTFLKELTNLHIKNIWQNVFIELQEASDLVFIGYSLPHADFEFKYILKKGINSNLRIQAILTKRDETNGTKARYLSFFGKGRVEFNFDGLEGWLIKQIK